MFSEERITSIIRVEDKPNKRQACQQLADFSTLKMEVIRSSEMLLHIRTTRRCIPEEDNFTYHEHCLVAGRLLTYLKSF
jgi:hypothetical protein